MRSLSILDGIRVASPCQASWDSMAGDDRSRFCSECRKNVYDLSAMTTAEAVAFVADREGDACVRFYRRADGTTLTADCPVGAGKALSSRFRTIAGLGVVGLAIGSTALNAVGLGRGPDLPPPSGPGVSINDWINWAMIKVGLRTPPQQIQRLPQFFMGKLSTRSRGERISADQY
jgi:hypothetical protein